jgi:hypothetical protein
MWRIRQTLDILSQCPWTRAGRDDSKAHSAKLENPTGRPEDCPPEQIRERHDDDVEYACQPGSEVRLLDDDNE